MILCAVLGGAAAFAYLQTATRTVTASTVLNINVISSEPFDTTKSPAGLIDPDTEVQKATSSEVLGQAAQDLGLSRSEIRRHTDAKLVPNTTIMKISFSASDVTAAENGADAVAKAYLDYRDSQAELRVATIVDKLEKQRNNFRDDLVRLNTIIQAAGANSARAVQAESDRQLVNIELTSLSSQINTYQGLDTTGGTVLSSAAENPTLVSPSRALVLATGIVLGLIVGILAAFAREAADRRVRDPRDVRRAAGGGVMAELHSPVVGVPAQGKDADAIRTVRELLLASLPSDHRVLAVADLTTGWSQADVAVNLAASVAETGRSVELVLADPSPEVLERTVTSLGLVGEPRDDSGWQRFGGPAGGLLRLTVPPAGVLEIPQQVEGRSLGRTAEAQMTVIGVTQGAPHSTLLAAGRLADSVLLVVSRSGTAVGEVAEAVDHLTIVGAPVRGTVLVPRRRKPSQAPG